MESFSNEIIFMLSVYTLLSTGRMFAHLPLGLGFLLKVLVARIVQFVSYGTCCKVAPIVDYDGHSGLSQGLVASTVVEASQPVDVGLPVRDVPRPAAFPSPAATSRVDVAQALLLVGLTRLRFHLCGIRLPCRGSPPFALPVGVLFRYLPMATPRAHGLGLLLAGRLFVGLPQPLS